MSSAWSGGHRNRSPENSRQDRVFELVSDYGPDVSRLCHAYPALLPGITGLSLPGGAPGSVPRFAGDDGIAGLQTLQDTLAEGPGRDATRLRQPVQATDLEDSFWQRRWPRFTAAALDTGVRAVYALPLHAGGLRHDGAVTVYRTTPGGWDDTSQSTIETFAAAACELLTLQHRGLDLVGAFALARRDPSILLAATGTPLGPQPDLATGPRPALPLIRWFQHATLPALRTHLRAVVTDHALTGDDRYRFVLAVHEAMTNAVIHGGGHGQLLLWHRDHRLWCEISDHGPGMSGTVLPLRPPRRADGGGLATGHGLWLIAQACAGLDITTDPTGTRLLLSYPADQQRTAINPRHAGTRRPPMARTPAGEAGHGARRADLQHHRRPGGLGHPHGRGDWRP